MSGGVGGRREQSRLLPDSWGAMVISGRSRCKRGRHTRQAKSLFDHDRVRISGTNACGVWQVIMSIIAFFCDSITWSPIVCYTLENKGEHSGERVSNASFVPGIGDW